MEVSLEGSRRTDWEAGAASAHRFWGFACWRGCRGLEAVKCSGAAGRRPAGPSNPAVSPAQFEAGDREAEIAH